MILRTLPTGHGLADQVKPVVDTMTGVLKAIAAKATAAP